MFDLESKHFNLHVESLNILISLKIRSLIANWNVIKFDYWDLENCLQFSNSQWDLNSRPLPTELRTIRFPWLIMDFFYFLEFAKNCVKKRTRDVNILISSLKDISLDNLK